MSFPKILLVGAFCLFAMIGVTALFKKMGHRAPVAVQPPVAQRVVASYQPTQDLPAIDRIHQLFTTGPTKLPIVETVTYSSQVSWLKGRPAWLVDYATYYATSRHFIARAINKKADYNTPKVSPGMQFNVFRRDRHFQFHLLVDATLHKMAFYYVDLDTNERVLLKTYPVGLGKEGKTPLGKFQLGDKIAVYRPGVMGLYREKQTEMITVFGTRWLPFEKGLGIHGVPWSTEKEQFVEQKQSLGHDMTDGGIVLATEDMEELFAIVVTKPTTVEIVKHFTEAKLPGVEVASPMR